MRSVIARRLARLTLVSGAILLGCSSAPTPDTAPPHFVVADVIVSVTNRSSDAMQIYAGTVALELPLGTVRGRSSRSFSLPSDLGQAPGPLHFEARGGQPMTAVRSDTFRVAPGQQVLWTVDGRTSRPVTTR